MEDSTDTMIQEYLLTNKKTQEKIENFEKDVKITLRTVLHDQWDPENQEIVDQLTDLANENELLNARISHKDLEIHKLREILADKRRALKQGRIGLESLKNLVTKTEESLFQRDLIILEQTEKISGLFETVQISVKKPQKTLESCKSNKFIPINGSYQGVYMTKSTTKLEDKGKQELNMPFLSYSAQNWISSLRTPTKSPKRVQNK